MECRAHKSQLTRDISHMCAVWRWSTQHVHVNEESRGSMGRRPKGVREQQYSTWNRGHIGGVEEGAVECGGRRLMRARVAAQSVSLAVRKDFPQVWARCQPIHALHSVSLAALPAPPQSLAALSAPARRLPKAVSSPAPPSSPVPAVQLPHSSPRVSLRLHVCFLWPPWQATQ